MVKIGESMAVGERGSPAGFGLAKGPRRADRATLGKDRHEPAEGRDLNSQCNQDLRRRHSVTDTRLEELTALLSFECMKGSKSLYQPVSVQWKEGFEFLRKGAVGDSKEYFGADEELLISSMLSREFPDGIPDWFSSLGLL